MADASQRKFDSVLVWKIDRWGRSLKHLVTSLAELDAYGVAFVSLRYTVWPAHDAPARGHGRVRALADSGTGQGAGLRNARAKGKKLGRPRAPVDESQVTSLSDSGASWAQSPKS